MPPAVKCMVVGGGGLGQGWGVQQYLLNKSKLIDRNRMSVFFIKCPLNMYCIFIEIKTLILEVLKKSKNVTVLND